MSLMRAVVKQLESLCEGLRLDIKRLRPETFGVYLKALFRMRSIRKTNRSIHIW